MDKDVLMEDKDPSGLLTHIKFGILSETDMVKYSVLSIDMGNDVTNSKLGMPNLSGQCSTCGARELQNCDGHLGMIKLPMDIFHPYFVAEVVKILNKICPGCKSVKKDSSVKGSKRMTRRTRSRNRQPKGCNYCAINSVTWYPKMKFKAASKKLFGKVASEVVVEVNENLPKKFQGKNFNDLLPTDYWNFIEQDPDQEERFLNSNVRTLSPAQVYFLLKDIDPNIIENLVLRRESLFLTCFPVSSNCNRVMETPHWVLSGKLLDFDDRTRAYKRLIDFKGQADELGLRLHDCIKASKLLTEKSTSTDSMSGSKWIKEVVLGKLTDYALRTVMVGDPNIKFYEIGISQDICQRLLISEVINEINWAKVNATFSLNMVERKQFFMRRNSKLFGVKSMDSLRIGDTVYRPLDEGDIVLVNRPPSVHQHSLMALSVHVLPLESVVSINPVCCSPLRGDFDGDCIHIFIPQSSGSRAELKELVSVNHQLINGQNGRNLLSLCHDSLTAAYLVREEGVYLNKFEMQQLAMEGPDRSLYPSIVRAPEHLDPLWTGKQLFSMLLPPSFDYVSPSNGVHISKGEVVASSLESSWLQDTDDNIFCNLIKCYGSKSLDILFDAQEVLLEWLSMRGFSVSLSDLYLCSDSSRDKMIAEVNCGLLEAEQAFHLKQLMVDPQIDYLLRHDQENQSLKFRELNHAFHPKMKTSLSQLSMSAFRAVFRDLQNLIFQYSSKDNSLLAMVKAGTKGNLMKLVQQSISLGLQHSSVPLSFSVSCGSSCAIWNNQKVLDPNQNTCNIPKVEVPYAVIGNSLVSGLNPAECCFYSLACRNSSFSNNADIPGSLSRRLMFYMRDLSLSYDGTVRNLYGNHVVQFSYDAYGDAFLQDNDTNEFYTCGFEGYCSPVGSFAAHAISEAAYSALDQPISILESSPLINLKKVLESGEKKTTAGRTVSLFLSKKLGRWPYGFERGALKVKSHLERVLLSDVVSTVTIVFTQQSHVKHISPWICHFLVHKEEMRRRGLNAKSVIESLNQQYNSTGKKLKVRLPKLQISRYCSNSDEQKEDDATLILTVILEISKHCPVLLDTVQDVVIPILLRTVIKGISEVKKVDIFWNDMTGKSRSHNSSRGELYMKIYMSENCKSGKCWSLVLNGCLQIMDLIDWERSHPDDIHDVFCAYGIGAAWKYFLRSLKAAVSDIGKTILPKHLFLAADTLSVTGEFLGLNMKGISHLRHLTSVSSPFMQACFSNPGKCFIKAAKIEAEDGLLGTLDAVAWGKEVPIGTGGQFEILYSGKGYELAKPLDVHTLFNSHSNLRGKDADITVKAAKRNMWDKWDTKTPFVYDDPIREGYLNSKYRSTSVVMARSFSKICDMSISLRHILFKYSIDQCINEADRFALMEALRFHPRSTEKIGSGLQDIKVSNHPIYQNSRCFMLLRTDGTVIDCSYRKCVIGAASAQHLPLHLFQKLHKALYRVNYNHVDQ